MVSKPWDSRIAAFLVRPLHATPVTPNHLTTLCLLLGLAAGGLFALGEPVAANWAAALSMLQALIDHADGELARQTGQSSRFGHYYDLFADLVNYLALFIGIGIGLRDGPLGNWAMAMGAITAIAVCLIFGLRVWREQLDSGFHYKQPNAGGFEIQDAMYIIGPVTWFGALQPFFLLAFIGTPVFAIWMLRRHRNRVSAPPPSQA